MKIISIANQKGGCGKTTTSINLVATLAVNGKRVLLLDLDPQAHATLGLDRDDKNSIYNVISRITPRKLALKDIIQNVDHNFDIVPSNVLVGTLEQELADEIGREMKLTDALSTLKDAYDYVIIDCPPSLGFLTVNAIRASHEIMIPVETSRFSVQGVDHLMDIINLIRDRLNHPVVPRVLITMFDSRLRHSFSMLEKIKVKFADMLLSTIVHTNVKLKESAVEGKTVIAYDKYCRGAKDYYTLAKELIAIHQGVRLPEAVAAERVAPSVEAEFSPKMKEMVSREMRTILPTTFLLYAPDAQSVYVAGSFNAWAIDESCRMQKSGDHWLSSLPLGTGEHRYQFIVDGRWQPDPTNDRSESNGFGDMNSIVEVTAHAA
ncbi:MAG: AAA family ATPase [Candidatus Omnitrophica bacterium]|nr:AAA family ATPase [Candidatus Omnitrophota bacterium]